MYQPFSYIHRPIFTTPGEMTDADKVTNPQNSGSDPADIWIRMWINPEIQTQMLDYFRLRSNTLVECLTWLIVQWTVLRECNQVNVLILHACTNSIFTVVMFKRQMLTMKSTVNSGDSSITMTPFSYTDLHLLWQPRNSLHLVKGRKILRFL